MSLTESNLRSFGDSLTVAVVGASGGIGSAFVDALASDPAVGSLWALSRQPADIESGHGTDRVRRVEIDVTNEDSIGAAAATIAGDERPLGLVIVASGLLHDGDSLQPEKSWRALDTGAFERMFSINTTGPALVAKHFLPLLDRDRKSVFAALSARVGSIADNRTGGWHAYRASKAALNMIIRTLAVELARRNPSAMCVGLHPGTVATDLSAPFRRNVDANTIFTPATSVGHLLRVIDGLSTDESGSCLAWDGTIIQP